MMRRTSFFGRTGGTDSTAGPAGLFFTRNSEPAAEEKTVSQNPSLTIPKDML